MEIHISGCHIDDDVYCYMLPWRLLHSNRRFVEACYIHLQSLSNPRWVDAQ